MKRPPIARRPLALWLTSLLLLGIAAIAAARQMGTFAAYALLMAVVPLRPRQSHVGAARGLGYGAFGWYALGLAPALSHLTLGGPFGGSPLVFAAAAGITVARLVALRHSVTRAWVADGLAREVDDATR